VPCHSLPHALPSWPRLLILCMCSPILNASSGRERPMAPSCQCRHTIPAHVKQTILPRTSLMPWPLASATQRLPCLLARDAHERCHARPARAPCRRVGRVNFQWAIGQPCEIEAAYASLIFRADVPMTLDACPGCRCSTGHVLSVASQHIMHQTRMHQTRMQQYLHVSRRRLAS
jgi:hypothetical protein